MGGIRATLTVENESFSLRPRGMKHAHVLRVHARRCERGTVTNIVLSFRTFIKLLYKHEKFGLGTHFMNHGEKSG